MTQLTDQERAEVIYTDQGINVVKDGVLIVFIPWEQAARRAQVVPQGWKSAPMEPTASMLEAAQGFAIFDGKEMREFRQEAIRIWRAMLAAAPQPPEAAKAECWCLTCRPLTLQDMRFVICPDCGNKRCPKANNHANACTNSNAPGQTGSNWEHVKPLAEAACNPSMQPELATKAAPVQMPKPVGVLRVFEPHEGAGVVCTEATINATNLSHGWHTLYTEHQVRQLLTAHGIAKN